MQMDEMMTHVAGHPLLLLSIGNELRGNDGIGPYICRMVGQKLLGRICYVSLGIFQSHIAQCMTGHDQVVVVDAVVSSVEKGSSLTSNRLYESRVIDMQPILEDAVATNSSRCKKLNDEKTVVRSGDLTGSNAVNVSCIHGMSWMDELLIAAAANHISLPSNISLFGIEVEAPFEFVAKDESLHGQHFDRGIGLTEEMQSSANKLAEQLYTFLLGKLDNSCMKQPSLQAY
jgi:hypothetical protein